MQPIKKYAKDDNDPLWESEDGWLVNVKDYEVLESEYKRVLTEYSKLVESYVDIRSKYTMLIVKLKEMTDIISK
jgi:hypothetical protein